MLLRLSLLAASLAVAATQQGAAQQRAAQQGQTEFARHPGVHTNGNYYQQPREKICVDQRTVKAQGFSDPCAQAARDQYRTIDGTCNNLRHPLWGASDTAYTRLLPSRYEDGHNMPVGTRQGLLYNGVPLPSPREVTFKALKTNDVIDDPINTDLVTAFGQYLDHDFTETPVIDFKKLPDLPKCNSSCINTEHCFPIPVTRDDPRVSTQRCISVTRSAELCGTGNTGRVPKEQVNKATSFVDSSQVYGSNDEMASKQRDWFYSGGALLATSTFKDHKPYPPVADDCKTQHRQPTSPCIKPGEDRADEHLQLMSFHVLFLREHNRIAKQLKRINPHWNPEKVYQETRKIVSSQLQHLTWAQWLREVIGSWGMRIVGAYRGYDANTNPHIFTEFATAAFRYGHGLLQPIVYRLNSTFGEGDFGNLALHESFFSSHRILLEGGVDPLWRGMMMGAAKLNVAAKAMHIEITEKLHKNSFKLAIDLGSVNIQRSREHAIQSYNRYREMCGMKRARTFADLSNEIKDREVLQKLSEIYKHPDNIDLFVGLVLEQKLPDAQTGPLAACLVGLQFKAIRDGDRFYYENPGVFTPAQLFEIKKSNFGRLFCDNGENIQSATANVYRLGNRPIPCSAHPTINLEVWRDSRPAADAYRKCTVTPQISGGSLVGDGQVRNVKCGVGFTQIREGVVRCISGNWELHQPYCKAVSECPPERIANGRLQKVFEYNPGNAGFVKGTWVEVICNDGFELPKGEAFAVQCTGSRFTPPVTTACVPKSMSVVEPRRLRYTPFPDFFGGNHGRPNQPQQPQQTHYAPQQQARDTQTSLLRGTPVAPAAPQTGYQPVQQQGNSYLSGGAYQTGYQNYQPASQAAPQPQVRTYSEYTAAGSNGAVVPRTGPPSSQGYPQQWQNYGNSRSANGNGAMV